MANHRNSKPPLPTRRPRGSASLMERAAVNEPVAIALPPAFEPKHAPIDALDKHLGIVRYLDLNHTLGEAVVLIGESNTQDGTERLATLRRALRYLGNEVAHLEREVV